MIGTDGLKLRIAAEHHRIWNYAPALFSFSLLQEQRWYTEEILIMAESQYRMFTEGMKNSGHPGRQYTPERKKETYLVCVDI